MRGLQPPIWTLAAVLISGWGIGCREGPELVEARGQVTYNGQPPPAAGVIYFAPIEDFTKLGARPASTDFGTDGRFEVQSLQNNPGLKPGRYRVTIQIWKERPQGYNHPNVDLVPRGYQFDELRIDRGKDLVEVEYDVAIKE